MKGSALIYITLVALLVGCGGSVSFPTQSNSATTGLSESALHFSNTVHPILSQRCAQCHGVNQPPLIAFSNNISKSYDNLMAVPGLVDFITPDNSRIVQRVRGGHNCWGNCADNADDLLTAIQNWKDLDSPSSTSAAIQTPAQTIPSTITTTTTANMTYNLTGLAPGIPSDAKLIVTIKKFDNFTYLVTNPRVTTTVSFYLRSLSLLINGVDARPGSTYSLIDATVPVSSTNSPYRLSTSSLLINIGLGLPVDSSGQPTGGPGVDSLALGFAELTLISSPAQQRFLNLQTLIRTQCAGCHGGTTNSQNGSVPAFANYTREVDFLNRNVGAGRALVVPGNPTESALYRSVAHLDGIIGHTYAEILRPMPPPPNNDPTRNQTQRAGYAETIRMWIQDYSP